MHSPVSVIIPVKNAESTLQACLEALFRAEGAEREVIVVDDGCEDRSLAIASTFPCTIVKNEKKGVSAARNTGARESGKEILFFTDSDIIVPPDLFQVLAGHFSDPDIAGISGLLGPEIEYENFASRYKNLWMHYTYIRLSDWVPLFYTSAAAVRKEVFTRIGGFDEHFQNPNVEDTEFGRRVVSAGYRIRLARDLQVEHRKHYDLRGVLRTDFYRSSGLVGVVLGGAGEKGKANSTSVPSFFIFSVPLFFLSLLCFILSIFLGGWMALAGAVLLISFYLLNWPLLRFFRRREGAGFAIKSLLFLAPDVLSVGGGVVHGLFGYVKKRRKDR
jgi:glycosyltransferase involved in cell wall biosynthesis